MKATQTLFGRRPLFPFYSHLGNNPTKCFPTSDEGWRGEDCQRWAQQGPRALCWGWGLWSRFWASEGRGGSLEESKDQGA